MYVGMSQIHRERDELPTATQYLVKSQELGEHMGLPQTPYRSRVAMARIREAEGDLGAALDLLDDAERLYVGDSFPNVRPVAAMPRKSPAWVPRNRSRTATLSSAAKMSSTCASRYRGSLNHITGSRGEIAGVHRRHDWAAEKRTTLEAWALHLLAEWNSGLS